MNYMHNFKVLSPVSFLDHAARAYPNEEAIVTPSRKMKFVELRNRAAEIKATLQKENVADGDCVGLLTENSLDGIASHFGIPACGSILVSFNPFLGEDTLIRQIQFTKMKVVLVSQREYRKKARMFQRVDSLKVIVLGEDEGLSNDQYRYIDRLDENQFINIQLDDCVKDEMQPIALNFTSGTTGEPKGVIYSHRAAYIHAWGQLAMFGLNRDSRYLWTLPMFHVNGWGHMWALVAAGAKQYVENLHNSPLTGEMELAIEDYAITHLAGSPRLLETIKIENINEKVRRRLTFMTGGATPPHALIENMQTLGVNLIHQYGLNETCGPYLVCQQQVEWETLPSSERAELTMRQGVPALHVPNGVAVISQETGKEVPWDGSSIGEITMSGNTVAIGYYDNPEATEKSFHDNRFWTGDLAVVHKDGYVELVDRIKDLIHVDTEYGWENVSSIEIEKVILSSGLVKDVAVVGFRNETGLNEIAAVIERSSKDGNIESDLIAYCDSLLPTYKTPTKVIEATIPKTATGKAQKAILRQQFSEINNEKAASVCG